MGTNNTKATDETGVADLQRDIAELRARHEADLRASHQHLTRQLAEIDALENLANNLRLIKRGRGLPRTNGAGRPTESDHPFPRAVGNVRAWAAANGVSWSVAKSWYQGAHPRPIQRRWQVLLERTYGIAASAWRGGVTEFKPRGAAANKARKIG